MATTFTFLTKNPKKEAEYRRQFGLYGIGVQTSPRLEDEAARESWIKAKLKTADSSEFVIDEQSDLYSADAYDALKNEKGAVSKEDLPALASDKSTHLERVYNISHLRAYHWNEQEKKLERYDYETLVEGHVNLRHSTDASTKWWDDIFIPKDSDRSYKEDSWGLGKVSARQIALGDFISEHVTHRKIRNLAFNPINLESPVDFERSPLELVGKIEGKTFTLDDPFIVKAFQSDSPWVAPMHNYLSHALDGSFIRGADSKRSGNYFLPPISGVPLYPKPDPFHQRTFQYHDLCHQALPDLLFAGTDTPENRMVYIAERMMSEAITLVMADMLFVDAAKRSGIEYDYSKRAINPLYDAIKEKLLGDEKSLSPEDMQHKLRELLKANVKFALLGDTKIFESWLPEGEEPRKALADYVKTYQHFFMPDLEWTTANYKDMTERSPMFSKWRELVGDDLFKRADLPILDSVTASIRSKHPGIDLTCYETAIDAVFDEVFETRIAPQIAHGVENTVESTRSKGFLRYMIGQMSFYAQYASVDGMEERGKNMAKRLRATEAFTPDIINDIRQQFAKDVAQMRKQRRITDPDETMFGQIHPLFSPRFLSYDFDKAHYRSIPEAVDAILGEPPAKLSIPKGSILVVASRDAMEIEEIRQLVKNAGVQVKSLEELEKEIGATVNLYPKEAFHKGENARIKADAVTDAIQKSALPEEEKTRMFVVGSGTDFILHGTQWQPGNEIAKGETPEEKLQGKAFPAAQAWQFVRQGFGGTSPEHYAQACNRLLQIAKTPWTAMESVVALRKVSDPMNHPPIFFKGAVEGQLPPSPQPGEYGFGFDQIFIPQSEINAGTNRSFAQMPSTEKNALSHRAKSMNQLLEACEGRHPELPQAPFIESLNNGNYAISLARRQPMHKGHAEALREIINQGATLVFCAGSSNTAKDDNGNPDQMFDPFKNPLTASQQREQLLAAFPQLYDAQRLRECSGESGSPTSPNMIFCSIKDRADWEGWYEQVVNMLKDPEFAKAHGFNEPDGMLSKAALCFRGKQEDKIPELDLNINGAPHAYKDVYAFDCFRDFGLPVWHAAGHDTPLETFTGTEFRTSELSRENEHALNGLAAPEAIIAMAEKARANNPDRHLLQQEMIPITALDLSLERLAREAGISTKAVFSRAKATGSVTVQSLTDTGKAMLQEWKKGELTLPSISTKPITRGGI